MSFLSVDIIKAFVKDNTWLTVVPEGEEVDPGVQEAFKQIDDIIYQKTRIAVPDDAAKAPAILRFHACALFVYLTGGKQGDISQDERLRRAKLCDDAMSYLNDVSNGDETIIDGEGNALSTSSVPAASFSSTKRLTEMP